MKLKEFWISNIDLDPMGLPGLVYDSKVSENCIHVREVRPNQVEENLIRISKDGDQFCFLIGRDLQCGICGFGPTPEIAWSNFMNNFTNTSIDALETFQKDLTK